MSETPAMLASSPVIVCVVCVRMLVMSSCVRTMKSLSSPGPRPCSSRSTAVISSATPLMRSAEAATLDRSMLRRVPLSLGAGVGTGHASRLQTNASVKSVKHVVGAKHKKISLSHRRIRWKNKENTT